MQCSTKKEKIEKETRKAKRSNVVLQYILANIITWCKNVLLFLAKRIEQTQVKKFIPGQSHCHIYYSRMLIKFKYASISDKSPSRCLVPNTLSQLIVSYRPFSHWNCRWSWPGSLEIDWIRSWRFSGYRPSTKEHSDCVLSAFRIFQAQPLFISCRTLETWRNSVETIGGSDDWNGRVVLDGWVNSSRKKRKRETETWECKIWQKVGQSIEICNPFKFLNSMVETGWREITSRHLS